MFLSGKLLLAGLDPADDVFEIRRKVFLEEQKLPEFIVKDDSDNEAIFALAFEETQDTKIPVGTARLLFMGADEEFKVGRLCVLPEYRGKGYADFLIRMLLDKAFQMGADKVYVDARLHAVGFYKKIGFVENGDVKMTSGFDEQPMVLIKETLCKKCSHSD